MNWRTMKWTGKLAILASMLANGASAQITNLCPDGSAPSVVDITITSNPPPEGDGTKVFVPKDAATYPLGRVEEDDTQTVGAFVCADPQTGLAMRIRNFIILPAGIPYATCLAVLETPILGLLGASGCAAVNQAQLGTFLKFPWRGNPSTSSGLTTNANSGNQGVLGCSDCELLEGPAKTLPKLAVTSNGNVAFALSTVYGTLASQLAAQGIILPPSSGPTSPLTSIANLVAPITPPGIYHVEAAFGPGPTFSVNCPSTLNADQCATWQAAIAAGAACPTTASACTALNRTVGCPLTTPQCSTFFTPAQLATAKAAFQTGNNCPTSNTGCTTAGITPATGVCPLSTGQCGLTPNTAAAWFSDSWVQGNLFGEWIVTGEKCIPNPDDQDPANGIESENPLTCDDPQPIAIPGCDGAQTTEDGCLTKLLPAVPTPTPTNTPVPTNTPTPTNTPGGPTPTPTNTPGGPTPTPQPTATPTPCPGVAIPVPSIGTICILGG